MNQFSESELVEEYGVLIRKVAFSVLRQLRLRLDVRDLESEGVIGLLEARQRYRSECGVPFERWAYYRVKGAMLDAVPRWTGVTRAQLKASAKLARMNASQAEACEAGISEVTRDPQGFINHVIGAVVSTSELVEARSDSDPYRGTVAEGRSGFQTDSFALVARSQVMGRVHEALAKLPQRDQEIIRAHYFEDVSLADWGERNGLSRSWASRLHAKAIRAFRLEMDRLINPDSVEQGRRDSARSDGRRIRV